eukprot:gene3699-13768_t
MGNNPSNHGSLDEAPPSQQGSGALDQVHPSADVDPQLPGSSSQEQVPWCPFDDSGHEHFPDVDEVVYSIRSSEHVVPAPSYPSVDTLANLYPVDFPIRQLALQPSNSRNDQIQVAQFNAQRSIQVNIDAWFADKCLRKALKGDSPTPSCDWKLPGLPFKEFAAGSFDALPGPSHEASSLNMGEEIMSLAESSWEDGRDSYTRPVPSNSGRPKTAAGRGHPSTSASSRTVVNLGLLLIEGIPALQLVAAQMVVTHMPALFLLTVAGLRRLLIEGIPALLPVAAQAGAAQQLPQGGSNPGSSSLPFSPTPSPSQQPAYCPALAIDAGAGYLAGAAQQLPQGGSSTGSTSLPFSPTPSPSQQPGYRPAPTVGWEGGDPATQNPYPGAGTDAEGGTFMTAGPTAVPTDQTSLPVPSSLEGSGGSVVEVWMADQHSSDSFEPAEPAHGWTHAGMASTSAEGGLGHSSERQPIQQGDLGHSSEGWPIQQGGLGHSSEGRPIQQGGLGHSSEGRMGTMPPLGFGTGASNPMSPGKVSMPPLGSGTGASNPMNPGIGTMPPLGSGTGASNPMNPAMGDISPEGSGIQNTIINVAILTPGISGVINSTVYNALYGAEEASPLQTSGPGGAGNSGPAGPGGALHAGGQSPPGSAPGKVHQAGPDELAAQQMVAHQQRQQGAGISQASSQAGASGPSGQAGIAQASSQAGTSDNDGLQLKKGSSMALDSIAQLLTRILQQEPTLASDEAKPAATSLNLHLDASAIREIFNQCISLSDLIKGKSEPLSRGSHVGEPLDQRGLQPGPRYSHGHVGEPLDQRGLQPGPRYSHGQGREWGPGVSGGEEEQTEGGEALLPSLWLEQGEQQQSVWAAGGEEGTSSEHEDGVTPTGHSQCSGDESLLEDLRQVSFLSFVQSAQQVVATAGHQAVQTEYPEAEVVPGSIGQQLKCHKLSPAQGEGEAKGYSLGQHGLRDGAWTERTAEYAIERVRSGQPILWQAQEQARLASHTRAGPAGQAGIPPVSPNIPGPVLPSEEVPEVAGEHPQVSPSPHEVHHEVHIGRYLTAGWPSGMSGSPDGQLKRLSLDDRLAQSPEPTDLVQLMQRMIRERLKHRVEVQEKQLKRRRFDPHSTGVSDTSHSLRQSVSSLAPSLATPAYSPGPYKLARPGVIGGPGYLQGGALTSGHLNSSGAGPASAATTEPYRGGPAHMRHESGARALGAGPASATTTEQYRGGPAHMRAAPLHSPQTRARRSLSSALLRTGRESSHCWEQAGVG